MGPVGGGVGGRFSCRFAARPFRSATWTTTPRHPPPPAPRQRPRALAVQGCNVCVAIRLVRSEGRGRVHLVRGEGRDLPG